MGIDQVRIDLFGVLERFLHGALGNFIEHHAKRRLGRLFGDDLLGQVLADGFAFSIRVSGEIDRVSFPGRLLKIGNDLPIVALLGIRDDLVFRLEIVLHIDAQPFGRQIFDMPDRGLHDEVLAEILIDCFRLGRRFDYYQILCHYT